MPYAINRVTRARRGVCLVVLQIYNNFVLRKLKSVIKAVYEMRKESFSGFWMLIISVVFCASICKAEYNAPKSYTTQTSVLDATKFTGTILKVGAGTQSSPVLPEVTQQMSYFYEPNEYGTTRTKETFYGWGSGTGPGSDNYVIKGMVNTPKGMPVSDLFFVSGESNVEQFVIDFDRTYVPVTPSYGATRVVGKEGIVLQAGTIFRIYTTTRVAGLFDNISIETDDPSKIQFLTEEQDAIYDAWNRASIDNDNLSITRTGDRYILTTKAGADGRRPHLRSLAFKVESSDVSSTVQIKSIDVDWTLGSHVYPAPKVDLSTLSSNPSTLPYYTIDGGVTTIHYNSAKPRFQIIEPIDAKSTHVKANGTPLFGDEIVTASTIDLDPDAQKGATKTYNFVSQFRQPGLYTGSNDILSVKVVKEAEPAPSLPYISWAKVGDNITYSPAYSVPYLEVWGDVLTIQLSDDFEQNKLGYYYTISTQRLDNLNNTNMQLLKSAETPDGVVREISLRDFMPKDREDGWLYIMAQNVEGVRSEPIVLQLRNKSPLQPNVTPHGLFTWNNRHDVVSYFNYISFTASLNKDDAVATHLEYQKRDFIPGQEYPTTPYDGFSWQSVPVGENGQIDLYGINLDTSGRLFVRAKRQITPAFSLYSSPVYIDLEKNTIPSMAFSNIATAVDQQLVQISDRLKIMGCYRSNEQDASYSRWLVYVINEFGAVGKLIVREPLLPGTATHRMPASWKEFASMECPVIDGGGIIGRISKTDGGTEILITPGDEDFTPYLAEATDQQWSNNQYYQQLQNPVNRLTVNIDNDIARLVKIRYAKWLGNDKIRLHDQQGNENDVDLLVFNRLLQTSGDYDYKTDMSKLEVGKHYQFTGFIGVINGQLAIAPVSATLEEPMTPVLYTPNLVNGTPDSDGFIEIPTVSESVTVRVKDLQDGARYTYTNAGAPTASAVARNFNTSFDITGLTVGNTRYITVSGNLNGLESVFPAKIKIRRIAATNVASIAAMKEREYDGNIATHSDYYRITGKAVIEEVTPQYLYLRDIDAESPTYFNYLLVHNENGWAEPTCVDLRTGQERSLREGDIIQNFGFSAIESRHNNLIADATDFARTFRIVEQKPDGYAAPYVERICPPDGTQAFSDYSLSADDRMVMIELKNARVLRKTKNASSQDINDMKYDYTLAFGDGQTTLAFDVFEFKGGFEEAWTENALFNIVGVVLLDGAPVNGVQRYALAPISFTVGQKLTAPEVYLEDIDPAKRGESVQEYTHGRIVISHPDPDPNLRIYWNYSPKDPFVEGIYYDPTGVNGAVPEIGNSDVEIRAYAAKPGATPSDVTVRRFVRKSRDVQYVLNFVNSAQEGEVYRFTSQVRVVAMGGEHLFVADKLGNHLPIHRTGGWDNIKAADGTPITIVPGDMLCNFLIGFQSDIAGNPHGTADGFESTFIPYELPSGQDFNPEPLEVFAITEAHAHSLVRIMNVTVNAPGATLTAGVTPQKYAGTWTITEAEGHATHPMVIGSLGPVRIYHRDIEGNLLKNPDGSDMITSDDFVDGNSYNIIGYVMLDEPGRETTLEVWPIHATTVHRTAEVAVAFNNMENVVITESNGADDTHHQAREIKALFTGMAKIELSCPTRDAKIYYSWDNDTWYLYQHPLVITEDCYLHTKAMADRAEESLHTHIELTKAVESGEVDFEITAETDKTIVSLQLPDGAPTGTLIWYSTGTDRTCSQLYTKPLEFTAETQLYACIQQPGYGKGKPTAIYVMVKGSTDEKTSGRITFAVNYRQDGAAVVTLSPEENLVPDSYHIYYTTDPSVTLSPTTGLLYNPSTGVVMTSSGVLMAILVESGKRPSAVSTTNVWIFTPTALDTIENDSDNKGFSIDGNNVNLPAGAQIYDIAGRRVRPTALKPGIYIVNIPGQSPMKILIP